MTNGFTDQQVVGVRNIVVDKIRTAVFPEIDEIKVLVAELEGVPAELNTISARVNALDTKIGGFETKIDSFEVSVIEFGQLIAQLEELPDKVTGLEGDLSNVSADILDIKDDILANIADLKAAWGNIGDRECFDQGYFSKMVSEVGTAHTVAIGVTGVGAFLGKGKSLQAIQAIQPVTVTAEGQVVTATITPYVNSMRELVFPGANTIWCKLGFISKRVDDMGTKVGALREGILPQDVVTTIQSKWASVLSLLNAIDGYGYSPSSFVDGAMDAIELSGGWRTKLIGIIQGEIDPFNLNAGLNAVTVSDLETGGALASFGSVLENFIGVIGAIPSIESIRTSLNVGAYQTPTCNENTIWGALKCRSNDITEIQGFFFDLVDGVGDKLSTIGSSVSGNRGFIEDKEIDLIGEGGIIDTLKGASDRIRDFSSNITGVLDRDTYRFYWYHADKDFPLELKTKIRYNMTIRVLEGNEDLTVGDVLPSAETLKDDGWSVTTHTSDTTGLLSLIKDGAGAVITNLRDWIDSFSAVALGIGIGEAKLDALRFVTQTTREFVNGEVQAQIRHSANEITANVDTYIFREATPLGVLPRLSELATGLGFIDTNLGEIGGNVTELDIEVGGIRDRIELLGWAAP